MPSSTAAVFATRWNACCDALEELDDNLVGESGTLETSTRPANSLMTSVLHTGLTITWTSLNPLPRKI